MEITNEEKSLLNLFSKIIRVNKFSTVSATFNLDYDNKVDDWSIPDEWYSYDGNGSVESVDKVNEAIISIINRLSLDTIYHDNGGDITVYFNAAVNEKYITFDGVSNTTETNSISNGDFKFSELEGKMKTWFEGMKNRNEFIQGVVEYDGGGDSGWVHNTIELDGERNEPLPQFVADWITNNLNYNWYDNEGGQGKFIFNFDQDIIESECEKNYDEQVEVRIPYTINFDENESTR